MAYSPTSANIAVLEKEFQMIIGSYFQKAFMLETGEIVLRLQMRRDEIDEEMYRILPDTFRVKMTGGENDVSEISKCETDKAGDLDEVGKEIVLGGIMKRGNYIRINMYFDPGGLLFLTDRSFNFPMIPHSFAMLLRKYLRNRRIRRVYQHQFDRVLVFEFGHEDAPISLVFEMFKEGNAILVKDGKIVQPLFSRSFSARTIRARHEYVFPPERFNPLDKMESELAEVMDLTEYDLVRCLAMDLNLGGALAEEIINYMALDKNMEPSELSFDDKLRIARRIREVLDSSEPIDWIAVMRKGNSIKISCLPVGSAPSNDEHGPREFESLNRAFESLGMEELGADSINDGDEGTEEGVERIDPRISKVKRKIRQQERGIEKFKMTIRKNTETADLIYLNYKRIESILDALRTGKEKFGWQEVRKKIEDIPDILSVDPATSMAVIRLITGGGEEENVMVDVKRDVNENASMYFERSKKAKMKMKGAQVALETSKKELERVGKKLEKESKGRKEPVKGAVREKEKLFWFEAYRWFISSDGNIVVGGKDAKGNEKVVKKYLNTNAVYIHSDIHGSPSVVVRSREEEVTISERTMEESGIFSTSHSRAWQMKVGSGTAFWAKPDQVSKTPQSGEFLPKGAFIVRGKRNWMAKLKLEMAVGKVVIEGADKLMCGPVSALDTHSKSYVIIVPGDVEKNKLARELGRVFGVTSEKLLSLLPPGGGRVVGSKGIDEALLEGMLEG